MKRRRVYLAATFALIALGLTAATRAPAAISITKFDGGALKADGSVATEAGTHPASASTDFRLSQEISGLFEVSTETPKDVRVDLPPGLIGNPQAVPSCTIAQMNTKNAQELFPSCPVASQVGVVTLWRNGVLASPGNPKPFLVPLFNVRAPFGTAGLLGLVVSPVPTYIEAVVRSGTDFGISAVSLNLPTTIPLEGATVEVWGVPADPSHDGLRQACIGGGTGLPTGSLCPSPEAANPKAFFTLPTSCVGPVQTDIQLNSWQGGSASSSFLSHDNALPTPNPIGNTDCEDVPFDPTVEVEPTAKATDSPTGLSVKIGVPQDNITDPSGTVSAHLKDTTVVLPEGLAVNPASANGRSACTPEQIGLTSDPGEIPITYTEDAARCPDAAKIGKVEIDTPLLDHSVEGGLYLAQPYDNPFDSLLAIYIAVEDPQSGVVVKLAGEAKADPQTGQLTTTFLENPQVPFEELRVELFSGARAPLRTPALCGTYTTQMSLSSWAQPEAPLQKDDSFEIDRGPGADGSCATAAHALPNRPSFEAGSVDPVAGAYTPFVVNLRREDASQEFSAITVSPPLGLTAKLAGAPPCSDASLAIAEGKSGRDEIASPSCPAASEVGSVVAGAGAGPEPFYAPGKAYMAGPYKGAPLSLAVITPAVAGPFDLGTIVVRTALYVNPRTAQITAESDPFPKMLEGIPLDIRSVTLKLDRPQFTVNPTSCEESAVRGSLLSTLGGVAPLMSRFQVGSCRALAFKPKLSIRYKGATKRGGNPGLRAVLTQPGGQANISSTVVVLPLGSFIDNAHINNPCTRAQYAEGACPKSSILGRATAWSPLLDEPLTGPVYFRSNGGERELPDIVAALNGRVSVELVGYIDAIENKKNGTSRVRNTFAIVPDAPVARFELNMKGGNVGLIENSKDLCKGKNKVTVRMSAHNGLLQQTTPLVQTDCGKKKKGKSGKGGGGGR